MGDSPTGTRARRPVAWMAGRRETEPLEPIDEAIGRMVSELPGRNMSERRGSLENAKLRRPLLDNEIDYGHEVASIL